MLSPRRGLDLEGMRETLYVVQFGRREIVRVICECRGESIDSVGAPTNSVRGTYTTNVYLEQFSKSGE